MTNLIRLFFVFFILTSAAIPVFAQDEGLAKLTFGYDRWISLHYLLQAQAYSQNEYDSSAGENESDDAVWSKGLQVRRSRIMLNGQVTKNIEFFMGTGDFFIGSQGGGSQYSTSTTNTTSTVTDTEGDDPHSHTVETEDTKGIFTQDAYINYRFSDELEIAIGMMPLPFMHHNRESAVSLLGIDYNSLVVPLTGTTNEWRDTGIEFRGLLGNAFDYRIGVFRGQIRDLKGTENTSDDINPYSAPRFCGRIQVNFADPETGFFYSGNYLGKKNIISFGSGVDYQNHAARIDGQLSHYMAWTGDFTVDHRIVGDMVFTLQGSYVIVKNQPESNIKTQKGYFVQAGFLLGSIQPVIRYQKWGQGNIFTDTPKLSYLTMGLNYYILGHNANIKLEYQNPMGEDNKAASGEKKATLQCQIFL